MPAPPMFDARLLRTRLLSPSVRELTFKREDGAPMAHEPGQWVSLILPLESGEVRRSYSIASPPRADGTFEIAVTHVLGGPGSSFLHDMAEGDLLRAIGPQGFFTRAKDAGASLFVATGTGVTPLRSMIHAARDHGDASSMVLLFGVRHDEDRLYADELAELSKELPHFRVEYTISQPSAAWAGRTGYVQTHVRALFEELAKDGVAPHAYICGLKRMIDAVRDLMKNEMQLPRQQVHSERYD
jgi:CDP-4-dehydro-6-deoxyglucose reductase, E3